MQGSQLAAAARDHSRVGASPPSQGGGRRSGASMSRSGRQDRSSRWHWTASFSPIPTGYAEGPTGAQIQHQASSVKIKLIFFISTLSSSCLYVNFLHFHAYKIMLSVRKKRILHYYFSIILPFGRVFIYLFIYIIALSRTSNTMEGSSDIFGCSQAEEQLWMLCLW